MTNLNDFSHIKDTDIMTEPELRSFLRVSRKTLWRMRQDDGFPKPISTSGRMLRFYRPTVLRWLEPTGR